MERGEKHGVTGMQCADGRQKDAQQSPRPEPTNDTSFIIYRGIPEVFAAFFVVVILVFLKMCIWNVKDWQMKPACFPPANLISFANNSSSICMPLHYYFYSFVSMLKYANEIVFRAIISAILTGPYGK